MQAQYPKVFSLAKIVFYPKKFYYPLLLPSHNCINNTMFSFQGAFLNSSKEIQWSFNLLELQSISLLEVVGQNGLEPSTSRLSVVCSSQLSYWPVSALLLVESTGIEPVTSCLQGRRSPSWANPPDWVSSILGTFFSVPSKLNNASIHKLFTLVLTLGRY